MSNGSSGEPPTPDTGPVDPLAHVYSAEVVRDDLRRQALAVGVRVAIALSLPLGFFWSAMVSPWFGIVYAVSAAGIDPTTARTRETPTVRVGVREIDVVRVGAERPTVARRIPPAGARVLGTGRATDARYGARCTGTPRYPR